MNLVELENIAGLVTFAAVVAATALFLVQMAFRQDRLKPLGVALMGVALLGSGAMLVARGLVSGHAPWSNLWESLVLMLFASLVFYFLVEWWYRPKNFGVVASPLTLVLLGGATILPAQFKGAAPLVPALQSYWLKVHVLIMLFSYAAFTMSFAAVVAYGVYAWRAKREAASPRLAGEAGATAGGDPFAKQLAFFDELTYRLILIGFPLLMLGIITGAMWANAAWGTYWSWDPKETWALITWFVYAAYLHMRMSRDWTGNKAAAMAAVGFVSMIITYIGVNYLSSGLHSYGFIR